MNETFLRDQPTYGVEGACAYMHLSETSLLELLGSGQLAGSKPGKEWVIRKTVMDAYLERLEREQTEQRREAFLKGEKSRVVTPIGLIRRKKRGYPVLPELPQHASTAAA